MLIPKRAFADVAQRDEFRQLAAEMLYRPAPAFLAGGRQPVDRLLNSPERG
jgi:hypothetical protein